MRTDWIKQEVTQMKSLEILKITKCLNFWQVISFHKLLKKKKKVFVAGALVAVSYNPSYLGGYQFKAIMGKQFERPHL
jgi:hypothetical protein